MIQDLKVNRMPSEIEKFARKFEVEIFSRNSIFPQCYATHALADARMMENEYLLSSELLGKRGFSCEIDAHLDTTKYVFFSLGKGYLKSENSIGLIYDPFALATVEGANIVMNDLLHVLSGTDILQNFCRNNLKTLLEILERNHQKLKTNKSKEEILQIFTRNLSLGTNLLVAKTEKDIFYGNIFELLLKLLPKKEKEDLKRVLREKIVEPNTIQGDLKEKIGEIFQGEKLFLDQFFDETKEERIIELRIPEKHRITKGLIGIYRS